MAPKPSTPNVWMHELHELVVALQVLVGAVLVVGVFAFVAYRGYLTGRVDWTSPGEHWDCEHPYDGRTLCTKYVVPGPARSGAPSAASP